MNIMKKIDKLALGLAGLLLASLSYGQATAPFRSASLRDNPGTLGHTFGDVNFSWIDFGGDDFSFVDDIDDIDDADADGYIIGLGGNTPIARGVDAGLGYQYWREDGHVNPFDGSEFDPDFHRLSTNATLYTPTGRTKAFFNGAVAYQWTNENLAGANDARRLRFFEDQWFFAVTGGLEIGLGTFSLTPRVSYTDTFDDIDLSSWHYGAELHTWFNEGWGGYLDATYHDPDRRDQRPESWTYKAGLRFRY